MMNSAKTLLSKVNGMKAKLLLGLAAIVLLTVPFMNAFAAAIEIESVVGVANQTRNETEYKLSTEASFDDELVFQVYYHNMEAPDSGLVANDLTIDVDMPTSPGKKQTVNVTLSAEDANTDSKSVEVNLDREDAYLEFIPGSVLWRHNAADPDEDVNIVTEKILNEEGEDVSDNIVTQEGGERVEDAKPCFDYDATVIFRARVIVPSTEVVKYVRTVGGEGNEGQFAKSNTASPGDTLEYAIAYKNAGNNQQTNAMIRDNFPFVLNFVEGSVEVANSNTNNERVPYEDESGNYKGDDIIDDGINVGKIVNPGAGANAYFRATIPTSDAMPCAVVTYKNVGVAFSDDTNQFWSNTETVVDNRDGEDCQDVPEEEEPTFACTLLQAQRIDETLRYKFTATADDSDEGVEVKQYRYDFGDGSDVLVTDQDTVEYEYDSEGVYVARLSVDFSVDGDMETEVTSDSCMVEINPNVTTPPEEEEPTELPDTGPAATIAAVVGTGALGQAARLFIGSRRALAEALLNR